MLDTHVHTCLSPCGDLDMHPAAVVRAAREAGVDALAVCDHNTAGNVAATVRAGRAAGVVVVPGLEIASEEEAHIVALLPDVDAAERLQARVYGVLPGLNDERAFGPQVLVNEDGEVLGFDEHLLIGATGWSVEQVVEAIHGEGGLAVAAHVDRERFGMVGQLGLIPPALPLDAIEVSSRLSLADARARYGGARWPILTGSDAHAPTDVGRAVTFMLLERPTLDEIRRAFANADGRTVLGGGRPMDELSLHILDIAQNGVEAGATRIDIDVVEDPAADRLAIEVRDNGRGMPADIVAKAADPFYTTRTTRRVGMGLPLLADAARASGGDLSIESRPDAGTVVRAWFQLSHVDRAPLGDLETTVLVLLAGHGDLEVRFRHAIAGEEFVLWSEDVRAACGGATLSSAECLMVLRRAIREGEARLTTARVPASR